MTQQEKNALLARFKAGSNPKEQDFAALVDAIDAAGAQAPVQVSPLEVVELDEDSCSQLGQGDNDYNGEAYEPLHIDTLIEWWEAKESKTVSAPMLLIYNKEWTCDTQGGTDVNTVYIVVGQSSDGADAYTGITALKRCSASLFVRTDDGWRVVDRGTPIGYEALADLNTQSGGNE